MAKNQNIRPESLLIATCYIIFAAIVVGIILSTTVPFGRALFEPNAQYLNIAISSLFITIGAFLPMLIGYLIGIYFLKAPSKLNRRFNGVLMGLLAFWVTVATAMLLPIRFMALPRNRPPLPYPWPS